MDVAFAHPVWSALGVVQHHIAQMGGAAGYAGCNNAHVPLTVGLMLLVRKEEAPQAFIAENGSLHRGRIDCSLRRLAGRSEPLRRALSALEPLDRTFPSHLMQDVARTLDRHGTLKVTDDELAGFIEYIDSRLPRRSRQDWDTFVAHVLPDRTGLLRPAE